VHGHNNVLGAVIFRIISAWVRRVTPRWSKKSAGSPRKKCAPPASSGSSRPVSPCHRTRPCLSTQSTGVAFSYPPGDGGKPLK
jgi:hypothetical protein